MNTLRGLRRPLVPFATALLQVAWQLNPRAYVTSGKRGRALQRKLYLDWVSGRSRYPAAVPGTSKHELGLAFDLGGLDDSQLAQLGAIWESWGGRWGGRFRDSDPIHFEA